VAAYTISDAGNILIDTAAATPAFCNKPDGTLTITAVSGLGKMLRYFIKTGSDTLSQWGNGKFTALTSGTYYAWVSDSSAVCRSAYSWPVVVPAISAPAFASVTATAENCGKHDGQIAISMSPGYVPQLQYFILSGTDTVSQWGNPIFNSLSGGNYRVWASDSSGCTSIYPMLVNVDKLTAPVITSVSTTPENGTASDGTITVVGSGSGLTFSLNGSVPQNIGTFGNLSSGTYSIKVTDAIGCDTLFYIEVTNLAVIRLTAIAGDGSACLGNVAVLPLLANSFEHVKSFKALLKYNSALLTCQNHLNVNTALFADSLHVDLFPASGELSVKWTGKTPVSLQDGSTLVELSFASLNAGQDSLKWDISPGICVFTDSLGNSINRELVQGKVRVYSIPEADVTQPLTSCEGADLQLAANYHTGTGNGTISYLWSGPGGFASDTNLITLTSVTPASAGQYSVSLSDTNHCQNQYSTEVSVTPTPVSGFTNDTLLFVQTYTLEANPGYYRYTWSTTDSTYSITVTAEGWYKVTLTTIGGCTATDSVLLLTAFAPLTMPNAFTPNGDIQNDVFKAVTTPEKISSYTLYIYDRWGKQVYFTNDVTQGWDGTMDGAAAPVGTYVYYVKYSNTSGAVREKRGMVVLVR
jgi:gliding motility-associated-like protein